MLKEEREKLRNELEKGWGRVETYVNEALEIKS